MFQTFLSANKIGADQCIDVLMQADLYFYKTDYLMAQLDNEIHTM